MNKKDPQIALGFIIFGENTAKYLPYFLPSLKRQTYDNFKVLVFDNLKMKDNKPYRPIKDVASTEYVKSEYPEMVMIDSPKNAGFARAHNKMIDMAKGMGAEYYLVANPDIVLDRRALENMARVLDENKDVAAVSPKILKWDFAAGKKTDIVDTCGIGLKSGLKFFDIGQGERDGSRKKTNIIGPSGACGLYRISVLDRIAESGKYFDENMFMYKEDCDLAYRMYLGAYKTAFTSEAVVYHDRTAAGEKGVLSVLKSRKKKSVQIKRWSFLNQQILFFKYWAQQGRLSKLRIILWQIGAFLYALALEQYLLLEYLQFFKIRDDIRKYR